MQIAVCLLSMILVSWEIGSVSAQLIVAHRGASFDAPENTLAAFRLAWEQKADAIEGDFHLTADNQIVCIHDADTARVSPEQPNKVVARASLAELQQLDVGNWKDKKFAGEKIPTLAEVLAIVPSGKQIFLEIKTGPEILPALAQQLKATTLQPEQIVLISFNAEVIQQSRKMLPQFRANWLTAFERRKNHSDKELENARTGQAWRPSLTETQQTLLATQASGLGCHGNEMVVDQPFVNAILKAGFECHAWTIDDPKVALRFKSYGVQSLTTNRPEFLRASLDQANKQTTGPLTEPQPKR